MSYHTFKLGCTCLSLCFFLQACDSAKVAGPAVTDQTAAIADLRTAPEENNNPDSSADETVVESSRGDTEQETSQGNVIAVTAEEEILPERVEEVETSDTAPPPEPIPETAPITETAPEPKPESLPEPESLITSSCDRMDNLTIVDAQAIGESTDDHSPSHAIDNNLNPESRWSSDGQGNSITFDLGSLSTVRQVSTAWYKADIRQAFFDVQTSTDNRNWKTVLDGAIAEGREDMIAFDLPDSEARYVRVVGQGNSDSSWNSLIEIDIIGCGTVDNTPNVPAESLSIVNQAIVNQEVPTDPTPPATPVEESVNTAFYPGNTDSRKSPAENFDLTYWKITYPDASEAYPPAVVANEFYTDEATGAMVFECVNRGERTSNSTKYARSELREMLRGTNDSIGTKSLGNNWVISAANLSMQQDAGAVDGNMKATVAVDAVSTTYSDGNDFMVGRVIVGQIHGSDNEPFKIYYRKLPGNSKGSVYFSYEDSRVEEYYEFFGSRSTDADNPDDGIALGEKWSYEVDVSGRDMTVTVTKEDGTSKSRTITWGSEYDNDWFYFKAGNYNQNNGGEPGDYAQVSIFALEVTH